MTDYKNEYVSFYKRIQELKELTGRVRENIDSITEEVTTLDIFWDGDANAEFMTSVSEDIAFCNAILLKISLSIKMLDKAYSQYQEMEKVIEQIIGGIKS